MMYDNSQNWGNWTINDNSFQWINFEEEQKPVYLTKSQMVRMADALDLLSDLLIEGELTDEEALAKDNAKFYARLLREVR